MVYKIFINVKRLVKLEDLAIAYIFLFALLSLTVWKSLVVCVNFHNTVHGLVFNYS